jgi:hypothetical protein
LRSCSFFSHRFVCTVRANAGAAGLPVVPFASGAPDRSDDEQRLNLQLRLRGRRLIRADLDLYLDLLDSLAARRGRIVEGRFAPMVVFDTGRWARLGLEYRY